MHYCAEQDILISFLDEFGRFLARVHGPVSGNVFLRREQYRIADSQEICKDLAAMLVTGKIANHRAVLRRFHRDQGVISAKMENVEAALSNYMLAVQKADSVDSIRGLEGKAADLYFSVFDELILVKDPEFRFSLRSRRPPLDRVNALLSFIYTLILHDTIAGLECVGLDPAVGFLHKERSGRESLALDLMEELRPYLGDRFILSLINTKRISAKNFKLRENGAVYLDSDARKVFLQAWQQRKLETITHPVLKEKMPLGLIFFVQARLLAKYIRAEMDYYLPFVWK